MESDPPPPRTRRPGRAVRLLVVLVSLLAAALLGEITLRCVLDVGSYRIWPPHLETLFRPAPGLMPGIEGESRFRINSRGLRGDEPDPSARYRILVLGGSTAECLYLDQEETWPALVQGLLRERAPALGVQVENAGVSGRDTRDHVVQARHLLPQLPDLDCVLLLCGVNDLTLRLSRDAA